MAMAAKSAKSQGEPRSVIKQEQWEMPVSFDMQGIPISLREYVKGDVKALSFSSLSDDQRTELAVERIKMQPHYEIGSIGAGIMNKEQALQAVRAKSKLGRTLTEIETRVILHVIDETEKRRS
jgi:hypothetical protein